MTTGSYQPPCPICGHPTCFIHPQATYPPLPPPIFIEHPRDRLAREAMPGVLNHPAMRVEDVLDPRVVARAAYAIADAMLHEARLREEETHD